MVELMTRWQNTTEQLILRLGREPSPAEVARRMKLKDDAVDAVRAALQTASRYTQSFAQDDDNGSDLSEMIEDHSAEDPGADLLHRNELARMLTLLEQLDDRQARILRMRFGLGFEEPMTLKLIGAKLGLTRERVRQIQNEALARLLGAMTEGEFV
jgi:RNA polymerase primary sigma factor